MDLLYFLCNTLTLCYFIHRVSTDLDNNPTHLHWKDIITVVWNLFDTLGAWVVAASAYAQGFPASSPVLNALSGVQLFIFTLPLTLQLTHFHERTSIEGNADLCAAWSFAAAMFFPFLDAWTKLQKIKQIPPTGAAIEISAFTRDITTSLNQAQMHWALFTLAMGAVAISMIDEMPISVKIIATTVAAVTGIARLYNTTQQEHSDIARTAQCVYRMASTLNCTRHSESHSGPDHTPP